MAEEMKEKSKYEFPDLWKYDKLGVVYNGGTALYFKGKSKWTCPVCGKYTLDEPGMNYDCPACGWEDDPCDLLYSDVSIGVNPVSYNQAKELWEKYHDDYHNHEDEFKLTFGVPDLDKWIEDNSGKITEEDLMEKVKEHFGDPDLKEESEEAENS